MMTVIIYKGRQRYALVAQRIEYSATNRLVGGSNPLERAKNHFFGSGFFTKYQKQSEKSMNSYYEVFEWIGTVAFAISGTLCGIHHRLDFFGSVMLGVTTTVGGGIIRDVVIGRTPPIAFTDPKGSLTALAVSTAFFLLELIFHRKFGKKKSFYNIIMFLADTLGLAAFTMIGVETTATFYENANLLLLLFVGFMTGTGGGILRDLLCGKVPDIFRKHIYALASIAGVLVWLLLSGCGGLAIFGGFSTVVAIRIVSAVFRLNLPVVNIDGDA